MPASSPLILEMDCPEPRQRRDRLVVSADGSTWDMDTSAAATMYGGVYNDLYSDPVNGLVMLYPLNYTAEWDTTFTGLYRRYGKADYDFDTPGDWVEYGRTAPGDLYLQGLGTNETVYTAQSLPVNKAVSIAVVVAGTGKENKAFLECGWGAPGLPETVSLRFNADGGSEVYKGEQCVGVYNFNDTKSNLGYRIRGQRVRKRGGLNGNTIEFTMIPRPNRSLLVMSSAGGSFTHTFADLDGERMDNVITPAAPFFWKVPHGQPCVQFAPLHYAYTGTIYSPVVHLRYAPSAGQTFFATIGEYAPAGVYTTFQTTLVKPDLSAFVPNGVDQDVRIKYTMSGDGTDTRFLYSVDFVCSGTKTATHDSPFDLTEYCTSLTMEVPEDGPATLNIECKRPTKMEAEGLAKARIIGDRPVRLSVGGKDIFRGVTGKPSYSEPPGHNAQAGRISWTATDRETEFDMYSFRDTFPYDGIGLTEAIKQLAKLPGFDNADLDVTDDPFVLPFHTDVSHGQFQLLPQRGDTANQWIKKLWEDYAKTWVKGWSPTPGGYKYRFRRPDTFTNTPKLELFETTEGARAFGSVDPDWITRRVVRAIKQMPEAAVANEVLAIGYDETTDTYPQAQADDDDSQNPELAPADRPDNWRGRVVAYQLIDTNLINSQATADRARDILEVRAMQGREIIELEADFLIRASTGIPLWKGDVVRIFKHCAGERKTDFGGPTGETFAANEMRGDYRILAIPSIEFILEGDRKVPIRPATYKMVKIGDGVTVAPGGSG